MMIKKDDYWLSRRPKYTVEQTFQMGVQLLLVNCRKKAIHLFKEASLHGHQEAQLYYKSLPNYRRNPEDDMDLAKWARDLYNNGQDPRVLRYTIWFSFDSISAVQRLNVEQATVFKEDPMYLFIVGTSYQYPKRKPDKAIVWYRRSAGADFGPASGRLLTLLSMSHGPKVDIQKEIETLCFRGCELGNYACFDYLKANSEKFQVDALVMLKYAIRDFLRGRVADNNLPLIFQGLRAKLEFIDGKSVEICKALSTVFMAGQEFDDYERYFIKFKDQEHLIAQRCVAVYRQITSLARHACVHTILILRSLGVCRDIAIVIAKLVYASRSETDWYIVGR